MNDLHREHKHKIEKTAIKQQLEKVSSSKDIERNTSKKIK